MDTAPRTLRGDPRSPRPPAPRRSACRASRPGPWRPAHRSPCRRSPCRPTPDRPMTARAGEPPRRTPPPVGPRPARRTALLDRSRPADGRRCRDSSSPGRRPGPTPAWPRTVGRSPRPRSVRDGVPPRGGGQVGLVRVPAGRTRVGSAVLRGTGTGGPLLPACPGRPARHGSQLGEQGGGPVDGDRSRNRVDRPGRPDPRPGKFPALDRIRQVEATEGPVRVEILRYGLSADEARLVRRPRPMRSGSSPTPSGEVSARRRPTSGPGWPSGPSSSGITRSSCCGSGRGGPTPTTTRSATGGGSDGGGPIRGRPARPGGR